MKITGVDKAMKLMDMGWEVESTFAANGVDVEYTLSYRDTTIVVISPAGDIIKSFLRKA